ncbi:DUF1912 family protein [Streptococcus pluranimalium]|uniref:DUF1912 family protein n=1 Tax=Streptococcus pluranimalium TaxID=82348 RepID=UPI003BF82763
MSKEEQFLKDFRDWVNTQIVINEDAMKASQQVWEEDNDERAKDAVIRYESRLDAYRFLQGKFQNFEEGKGFHDIPDDIFGKRSY